MFSITCAMGHGFGTATYHYAAGGPLMPDGEPSRGADLGIFQAIRASGRHLRLMKSSRRMVRTVTAYEE